MTDRIIAFATDFGLVDPYVAEVKVAILATCAGYPAERIRPTVIDVSHGIPAGDVEAAGWLAARTSRRFPVETIHLFVVDPGVGTDRPAVAVRALKRLFVGPGNGLFSFLAGADDLLVVRLEHRLYTLDHAEPSHTFHGRDVFAPAAAHLAMGVPLEQVGTPGDVEDLGVSSTQPGGDEGLGRVVWIDRFGNAITNIARDSGAGRRLERGAVLAIADTTARGPVTTYGSADPDDVFWYWGSDGYLELAMRDENVAVVGNLSVGMALNEVMS